MASMAGTGRLDYRRAMDQNAYVRGLLGVIVSMPRIVSPVLTTNLLFSERTQVIASCSAARSHHRLCSYPGSATNVLRVFAAGPEGSPTHSVHKCHVSGGWYCCSAKAR